MSLLLPATKHGGQVTNRAKGPFNFVTELSGLCPFIFEQGPADYDSAAPRPPDVEDTHSGE
jgi:hypothetical protein